MLQDFNISRVNEELSEYIFSTDIIRYLSAIIQSLIYKNEHTKNVYWVSGEFGAGKSHFMKYLYFMLNKNTSKVAFDNLYKVISDDSFMNVAETRLSEKKIELMHFDFIMFNADVHTYSEDTNILDVILNEFNQFRGYNSNDIPLAILLEKKLDKKGVFEQFKVKVEEVTGFNWNTDAAVAAAFQLNDIINIAKEFNPEIDKVLLHAKLSNPDSLKVGINATLIPELKEFLKDKDSNYRLIFMIDNILSFMSWELNHAAQILQLKSLLVELTVLDSRISFVASSQVNISEDLSIEKLLDRVCGTKIHLSKK